MATLSDAFKRNFNPQPFVSGTPVPGGGASISATPGLSAVSRQLPNDGGTYQSPAPTQPSAPVAPTKPIFPSSAPTSNVPPQYINPATGGLYSPAEFADNVAASTPGGDIPKFAGDQFSPTPQTTQDVMATASGLNNTRNDIATGTTDPYSAAGGSGVAYSPAELKAIESAYAGVYDPAINSALSKLDLKQKADAAALAAKQRQDEAVFNTNENIRQYEATTGAYRRSILGGSGQFTKSQINKGASNSGMDIGTFAELDPAVQNFYINSPTGTDPNTNKSTPIYKMFEQDLADVTAGKADAQTVTNEIMGSNLPDAVKQYFTSQIKGKDTSTQNDGFWANIGQAFGSLINGN